MKSNLHFLKEIHLQSIKDERGNLGVLELQNQIDFHIQRIYYLSNVPEGEFRGAHAHINLEQIFLAPTGKCILEVTDGKTTDTVELSESGPAYYLPAGYWRNIFSFTNNAVCLVLASLPYSESDYIRDFDDYLKWKE